MPVEHTQPSRIITEDWDSTFSRKECLACRNRYPRHLLAQLSRTIPQAVHQTGLSECQGLHVIMCPLVSSHVPSHEQENKSHRGDSLQGAEYSMTSPTPAEPEVMVASWLRKQANGLRS